MTVACTGSGIALGTIYIPMFPYNNKYEIQSYILLEHFRIICIDLGATRTLNINIPLAPQMGKR
jgi:hypothetical protein